MKLKCIFEYLELNNDIIAVPVGDDANGLHAVLKLNKEGWEIMGLLAEETTEEAIVSELTERYDNDQTSLSAYVHSFIQKLKKYSLLFDSKAN